MRVYLNQPPGAAGNKKVGSSVNIQSSHLLPARLFGSGLESAGTTPDCGVRAIKNTCAYHAAYLGPCTPSPLLGEFLYEYAVYTMQPIIVAVCSLSAAFMFSHVTNAPLRHWQRSRTVPCDPRT